jgi:hypothetical protein
MNLCAEIMIIKFKQEEWKVLYNSTNKYIDETNQAEAPSFSREQLDDGFSKLNVDSPFSIIYITFAVVGMLLTSSGYEIQFNDVVLSKESSNAGK